MSITIDFSDYKYEAGDLDDEIQRANDATLADFIVYLVRNDKEDNAKQRFNEIIRPHIRESLSQDHSGTLKAILGKHLLPLGHDRLAAIINKYMAILAPASKKRAVYAYTLHLMNSASVLFEMVNQVQQNAPEAKPSKKPRKITVPDTATANGQLLKDVEKTIENLKTSGKCIEGWYTQSWLKQVVAGNYSFGESIPEYRFNDPDGVLRNIRQAAKVLMECVKAEEFNLGMKLVRALLKIEVPVDGDLEGEEKLWLGELKVSQILGL